MPGCYGRIAAKNDRFSYLLKKADINWMVGVLDKTRFVHFLKEN